ncbi:putative lipid-A-disaccharide synthase, mitochondrial, partial [Drosera capensis]
MFASWTTTKIRFSISLSRRVSSTSRALVDAAARDGEIRVFIVAGEISGDSIGGRLMGSVRKLSPFSVRFAGVGGSMMSQHGLKSLFPMEDISVMGIWELLPHLYKIRMKLKQTVEAALQFKPHAVVTVDSKGFSFWLLKQLRARYSQQGVDTPAHFHYVAPSFWAWKGGETRLKGLANFVDHVFCILPFEAEVCRSNGLDATFVGHPVLEDALELCLDKDANTYKYEGNGKNFRSQHGIPQGTTLIAVLPGSRLQEVTRMLPIFSKTMELLKGSLPQLSNVMPVAPNRHVENYVTDMAGQWPVPMTLFPGGLMHLKYDALKASDAALCTSGTAAVELQLAQLPSLVAYRAHVLTEWLIRYKAKVPYMSLPNILLNSSVIPEALFDACSPTTLASSLRELIHSKDLREQQIVSAEKVIQLLRPPPRESPVLESRWASIPSMIAASTLLYYR